VVVNQIAYPRPSGNVENPVVSMPRNLVVGQDAEDVAAYVGSVAGVEGAAPPKVPGGPGAQVFANNGCGGCHTLAEAKAGGTTGPDLDEVLPSETMANIQRQIIDPSSEITKGFPSNVMPENYEELIPPDQLKLLVAYLVSATGAAKGGAKSAKKG
jgi:mono/diheme cytochrome c family protein